MPLFVVDKPGLNEAIAEHEINRDLGIGYVDPDLTDAALFGYSNDVYRFKPGVISRFVAPMYYDTYKNEQEGELYFLVSKDNWIPYSDHAKNIVKYDLDEIIYGHKGARLPSAFLFLEPDLEAAYKRIKRTSKKSMANCNNKNCAGCECYCVEQLKEMLSHFPPLNKLTHKRQMCTAIQYLHDNDMIPFQMSFPFINKSSVIGILGKRPSPEVQQVAQQAKVKNMPLTVKKKISDAELKRQKKQPPTDAPLHPSVAKTTTQKDQLAAYQAAAKRHEEYAKTPSSPIVSPDRQPDVDITPLGLSRRRNKR